MLALVLLLSVALCGLLPKAPKQKLDMYQYAKVTKTLDVKVEKENSVEEYQGLILSNKESERAIVVRMTAKDKEEEEEDKKDKESFFFKFVSESPLELAIYSGKEAGRVVVEEEEEMQYEWTQVFSTKVSETAGEATTFMIGENKAILRILNYQAAELMLVGPDTTITTYQVKRTVTIERQSKLKSMLMPMLMMIPMQLLRYKQNKKMLEQQQAADANQPQPEAPGASQTPAAPAAPAATAAPKPKGNKGKK